MDAFRESMIGTLESFGIHQRDVVPALLGFNALLWAEYAVRACVPAH